MFFDESPQNRVGDLRLVGKQKDGASNSSPINFEFLQVR
jgi:hypothetical protein